MSLDINWVESLVNIGEALVVALVTSGLALFFTKKYFKQITFANKMKKYGFPHRSPPTTYRPKNTK